MNRRGFLSPDITICLTLIGIVGVCFMVKIDQARSRSRMGGTMTGLRCCKLAIEAYRIDQGWVPWEGDAGTFSGTLDFLRGIPRATGIERGIGFRLTTPV